MNNFNEVITVYKKFFLMLGVTILLCLSASVVWSENIDDLVKRNGVYYKKFSDVPFNGKVDGNELISNETKQKVLELKEQGLSYRKIKEQVSNISLASISRVVKEVSV